MGPQPRPLSNNVRACIDDIIDLSGQIWTAVGLASERAQQYRDPDLLAALNRITRGVAEIRQHAADAQHNVYRSHP